jgi:hypothetical protein
MPTVEQLNSLFSARTQTRQPSVHSRQIGPTSLSWAPADVVPLQSRNHLILEEEPAYARFVEKIRSFLLK